MTRISTDQIKSSLIDLSQYDVRLHRPDPVQGNELPQRVARMLSGEPGWCVVHGTGKVLARHRVDAHAQAEAGYALLESLFKAALAMIDFRQFSVTPRPMTLAKMDVDGYNMNKAFSHDGKVEGREFMTAKCIHFDAATPFVANIYGPTRNIRGGHPLICDVKRYCRDTGRQPGRLVENIPNNYNIVIKRDFYEELRRDYSFALDLDVENDIIMVMLLNEIEFGVAHGATDPFKCIASEPACRPIRHFEYQYAEESHYEEWYRHYGLAMAPAKDYQGENLSLDYYQSALTPFQTVIRVNRH
jgi:hypothetical protein